jgi:hypothetical protein
MIRKLLPVFLLVLGTGAGMGAGLFLRPSTAPPEEKAAPSPDPKVARDYVRLPNQFVVPILENGRVQSLVILSLSLEVPVGGSEAVYAREPKLRDGFLQVLYGHANAGGFRGTFTEPAAMDPLRRALFETATSILGEGVSDVLISEMVRQDS